MYNYANVLHQLDRDEEAYEILMKIIVMTPTKAKKHCSELVNPRSFIIDSHFLLLLVMIYGQGYSEEAFNYAKKHLKLRTRGIKSCWTKRYIENEIKNHYKEWQQKV